MPSITIKNVNVNGESLMIEALTDVTVGTTAINISITISRPEVLAYMQDNSGKNVYDLILLKFKDAYSKITKLSGKANSLLNTVLTW